MGEWSYRSTVSSAGREAVMRVGVTIWSVTCGVVVLKTTGSHSAPLLGGRGGGFVCPQKIWTCRTVKFFLFVPGKFNPHVVPFRVRTALGLYRSAERKFRVICRIACCCKLSPRLRDYGTAPRRIDCSHVATAGREYRVAWREPESDALQHGIHRSTVTFISYL